MASQLILVIGRFPTEGGKIQKEPDTGSIKIVQPDFQIPIQSPHRQPITILA